MKTFFLFLLLGLFTASCGEEIESYDTLSDQEQSYIRQRASIQCLADSLGTISKYKDVSNKNLLALKRGDHWKIVTAGVTTPDYMYVWNVVGTKVFLLYQQKIGNTTYHKFIKLTSVLNGEMIDDLRIQKCASKIPAITNSSSTFTIKFLDQFKPEGTVRYRSDLTYSSTSSLPALFSIFSMINLKKKLNDNNEVVSSETFTNSITYENDNGTLFATYAEYDEKQYCVPQYTNSSPKTFVFPFELNCVPSGDPNAGGDPDMNFNWAIEL